MFFLLIGCSTTSFPTSISAFVETMTLQEKLGQMLQIEQQYILDDDHIADYGIGSLLSGGGSAPEDETPQGWVDMVQGYQNNALQSRLKIPLIYGIDAIHGHNNVKNAVIYPHNIGLGATGNAELVEEIATATAEDVAGTGIHWDFAPCVAVGRDERWGRTYESFSEDVELVSELGAAAIRGLQSTNPPIIASAKHYVGDGGTVYGEDQGDVVVTEEELRKVHLKPFEKAVEEGVGSIMVSYSSWNGVYMHENHYLLTEVLRDELGFEGIVISDWGAVYQLPGDEDDNLESAINAGIDIVMLPSGYENFFEIMTDLVETERISVSRINQAVENVIRVKRDLGLFDGWQVNPVNTQSIGLQRELARRAVSSSVIVLKNQNGVLPLSKSNTISLSGKSSDNIGLQCGGWTIEWQGESGDITEGTTIKEAIGELGVGIENEGDINIVAIGEEPYAEYYGDNLTLELSDEDVQAVITAAENGNPVVVILVSGRPLILEPILDLVDALVVAWLPGTEAAGITDVLFGDIPPTGKLPFSWPRSIENVPLNYGDDNYDPLFPLNFGLNF